MLRTILIIAALLIGLPAQAQITNTATTNRSATITTGNTFQTLMEALASGEVRRSLTIVNNNTSDSCWVFIGSATPTKATSILLLAGGSYTRYFPYVPSDKIQVTCTTTSDTLYVDTQ